MLAQIARELTDTIRNSVTIDWTVKETVRAKLRTLVRRKLKKHGYPPDKTEKAVETVLKQAELLAADWVAPDVPRDPPVRIKEHDVVTLDEALPAQGLKAGERGTVVHLYADGRACEVEFVTKKGSKVVTLRLEQVRAAN